MHVAGRAQAKRINRTGRKKIRERASGGVKDSKIYARPSAALEWPLREGAGSPPRKLIGGSKWQ